MDDLRKLRHAVALAREGSYARASRAVNLSQPALTRSIQSLEAEMGVRLFERHSKGVLLSKAGAAIIEQARLLLLHAGNFDSETRSLRSGQIGQSYMGIDPMLAPVLERVLVETTQVTPRLQLQVHIRPLRQLMALLLDEQIDFFVGDVTEAKTIDGLVVTPVAQMDVGYYVRSEHPLLDLMKIGERDLIAYPQASLDLQDANRGMEHAARGHRGGIACEDVRALKATALAGNAIVLGASVGMDPELAEGLLVRLPLSFTENWISTVGIVEIAGNTRTPAVASLIGRVSKQLELYDTNGAANAPTD